MSNREPMFFCTECDDLVHGCPHPPQARVELSRENVRSLLRAGGQLTGQPTRPQIAARPGAPPPSNGPHAAEAGPRAPHRRGFIVWFTGLSGAGKSTLAQAVRLQLLGTLPIEVLDGDEVRAYLSRDLGFSKGDRDTNVRRIGFVARVVARNGVGAVAAAISPYAQVRNEVRQLATAEGTAFIEVYAHAELHALVARDVKGLYKRAIAGELQHFTGVNDPYEPPDSPEVVVHTDRETVSVCVARILARLSEQGLIPSSAAEVDDSGRCW